MKIIPPLIGVSMLICYLLRDAPFDHTHVVAIACDVTGVGRKVADERVRKGSGGADCYIGHNDR